MKITSIAMILLAAAGMAGDNWPGWRGPERNGKSGDQGLMGSWPEGGPPLLWRSEGVGSGYSSLCIVDDAIYTMGDLGEQQFVFAAARADGKIRWKTEIGPAHQDQRYGGTRGTPTYSDGKLYVISTKGKLLCLNAKDGQINWQKDLTNDLKGAVAGVVTEDENRGYHWQFAESPLVDGERVVVTPGMPEALMTALDKKTGNPIWVAEAKDLGPRGGDGCGYASIVISHGAGVKQYVQLVGRGVIGVDAASGRVLWHYNRVANHVANIATPIVSGDLVFATTGYGTGAAALRLKKTESGVDAEEIYFLDANVVQNHHGGLILHEGHIYTGTGHNNGFPICLELESGKVAWGPVRNEGKASAAVTYADGHLYFRYQNGLMVLVEATPKAYVEKGSFMIPDVNQFSWSHPVIVGNKLYLREQNNVFCYDLAKPQG